MLGVVRITLALVAVTLLAAGCGSSQRVEYERDLAAVGKQIDRSLNELPDDDSRSIAPEQVRQLADDLRESAGQVDDLDAPDDVADAQRRLVRGLRGVARAFDGLADDLVDARTDAQKAELFVQFSTDDRVDRAFDDLIGAQEAYARHGYRVFTAPSHAAD